MTLNPYQGLKPTEERTSAEIPIVEMTLNPYQGLKLLCATGIAMHFELK
jgi:hypothetical protein